MEPRPDIPLPSLSCAEEITRKTSLLNSRAQHNSDYGESGYAYFSLAKSLTHLSPIL